MIVKVIHIINNYTNIPRKMANANGRYNFIVDLSIREIIEELVVIMKEILTFHGNRDKKEILRFYEI